MVRSLPQGLSVVKQCLTLGPGGGTLMVQAISVSRALCSKPSHWFCSLTNIPSYLSHLGCVWSCRYSFRIQCWRLIQAQGLPISPEKNTEQYRPREECWVESWSINSCIFQEVWTCHSVGMNKKYRQRELSKRTYDLASGLSIACPRDSDQSSGIFLKHTLLSG